MVGIRPLCVYTIPGIRTLNIYFHGAKPFINQAAETEPKLLEFLPNISVSREIEIKPKLKEEK